MGMQNSRQRGANDSAVIAGNLDSVLTMGIVVDNTDGRFGETNSRG
jgi:hypothetical protein